MKNQRTTSLRSLFLAALLLPASMLFFSAPAFADVMSGGQFKTAFSSFLGTPALAGEFQIVEEGGQKFVEFGAGFKASKAPDLKVFLSQKAPNQVTGKNAVDGSVRLGLLMKFEGSQRYAIPEGTDLNAFTTVIVHCEEYSKLWGTGSAR